MQCEKYGLTTLTVIGRIYNSATELLEVLLKIKKKKGVLYFRLSMKYKYFLWIMENLFQVGNILQWKNPILNLKDITH